MTYVLEGPDGLVWKIEDGDRAGRWALFYRRGATWIKVAPYVTPGAAALAVASGDTGIDEWDAQPRDVTDYALSHWRRTEQRHSA